MVGVVAASVGDGVRVGATVGEGDPVATAILSGVGEAADRGDGATVGAGAGVGVTALGAGVIGVGVMVATASGEAVGVDPREGEGLTDVAVSGDRLGEAVGDRVGETIVTGVAVSVTVGVSVSIVGEGDAVVSASLLAVVEVGLKINDPIRVAIITPQRANNIPVFIAGDISSELIT